ncbi:DNA cytosine methyltransferase [Escherichia coli]
MSQTFPLDYKFIGSLQSRARRMGNAVPPKMSETIGKHLLNIIKAS